MSLAPKTIPNPHHVLKQHGLKAKKALGQNFLTDISTIEAITQAGGLDSTSFVFEIGAGCGTLTHALGQRAQRVVALEYDDDLFEIAQSELSYAPHVEIRKGDIRTLNWDELSEETDQPMLIFGNLPYYLSSDIVLSLLEQHTHWSRACFLVQLEFAQRICASPGRRQAGSLSALAHLLTYPSLLFQVPPHVFSPPPKVESAVMVLERRSEPAFDVGSMSTFRSLVRAVFNQRRKMLRRSMKAIHPDPISLLHSLDLDPTYRGEQLSLRDLARISSAMSSASSQKKQ